MSLQKVLDASTSPCQPYCSPPDTLHRGEVRRCLAEQDLDSLPGEGEQQCPWPATAGPVSMCRVRPPDEQTESQRLPAALLLGNALTIARSDAFGSAEGWASAQAQGTSSL